MDNTGHDILNALVVAGAEQLDLTPTQHARAVAHYEAVGEYPCGAVAGDGALR